MEKLWLDVPYSDNDEVGSLGGRFDPARRQWWGLGLSAGGSATVAE